MNIRKGRVRHIYCGDAIVDIVHCLGIRGNFGCPFVGYTQAHWVILGAVDLQLGTDACACLGISCAGLGISLCCIECIDICIDDHGGT